MKKYIWSIAVLAIAAVVVASVGAHAQTSNRDLSGWAWSSNIGWVSFNSENPGANPSGTGAAYKVQIEPDGDLVGWAWSSNIGWIKFGDLPGHPPINGVGSRVDGNSVTGWIRACAGTINNDCNSATRTDGWDGWINLSEGSSGSIYPTNISGFGGVTYVENSGVGHFKGYAWGGDVVGWLKFDPTATADDVNVNDGGGEPSFTLSASPSNIETGDYTTIIWNKSHIDSCSVTSGASYWSQVNQVSGGTYQSGQSGSGTISFGTAGSYTMGLSCDPEDPSDAEISRSVTITVSDPAALSCVQPTRSIQCSDTVEPIGDAIFNFGTVPDGTPVTTVVESCPIDVGTYYCNYVCQPGYKKQGNKCVSSSLQEI